MAVRAISLPICQQGKGRAGCVRHGSGKSAIGHSNALYLVSAPHSKDFSVAPATLIAAESICKACAARQCRKGE